VGNNHADLEAVLAAAVQPVLVRTGYGNSGLRHEQNLNNQAINRIEVKMHGSDLEGFQAKKGSSLGPFMINHVCRDCKWLFVPPDCALDYYAKTCAECGAVIETSPVPPPE
jgi:hypothetical protein